MCTWAQAPLNEAFEEGKNVLDLTAPEVSEHVESEKTDTYTLDLISVNHRLKFCLTFLDDFVKARLRGLKKGCSSSELSAPRRCRCGLLDTEVHCSAGDRQKTPVVLKLYLDNENCAHDSLFDPIWHRGVSWELVCWNAWESSPIWCLFECECCPRAAQLDAGPNKHDGHEKVVHVGFGVERLPGAATRAQTRWS